MTSVKFLTAGAAVCALLAGPAIAALDVDTIAPDFTADGFKDGEAYHFDLAEARAQGPVVLYFFPGANTPGCDIEAQQFAAAMDQFEAEGALVVGATAMVAAAGDMSTRFAGDDLHSDEARELMATFSQDLCDGKFPVTTVSSDIAAAYDVAMDMGGNTLTQRTSYVIAPDGTVLFTLTENSPQPHIEQTLAAVREYNESHASH